METSSMESLNTNISKAEYKKLLELMDHYYSITPDSIIKQNSLFLITSKEDTYCLRKIKDSQKNTIKSLQLIHYLVQSGFNILDYIKTNYGKELLRYNKNFYYLSNWKIGRKGSYTDFNDIKNVALMLADFHLKSQGYYDKHISINYMTYNLPSILDKYKKVFSIITEIINHKKIKTMFDILYLESIEFFQDQLELSIHLLSQSNYNRILQNAQLKCTLCVCDFNLRNILVCNNEEYYFTSLKYVKYNINVFDLCKFIKKTMYKKEYSWDFKYAREIIDNYCIINPLSKDEISILLSLIIFPKQFYKIGKKKYIKKKRCEEDRYLSKLYKITMNIDKQKEFVEEYIRYYSINN